jgi:hypothetical protein
MACLAGVIAGFALVFGLMYLSSRSESQTKQIHHLKGFPPMKPILFLVLSLLLCLDVQAQTSLATLDSLRREEKKVSDGISRLKVENDSIRHLIALAKLDQDIKRILKTNPEFESAVKFYKTTIDSLKQLLDRGTFAGKPLYRDSTNNALRDLTGNRYEKKVLMLGPDGNYVSEENWFLLRIPIGLLTDSRLALIKQFVQAWGSLDQALNDQARLLQLQREVK